MNPYALLGVAPTASEQAISAAYHRMLKLHHPDRFATASVSERLSAEEMTRSLNEAMSRIRSDRASGWTSPSTGTVVDGERGDAVGEEDRRAERLRRLANETRDPSVVDLAAGRMGERAQKAPQPVERRAATAGALVVLLVVAATLALVAHALLAGQGSVASRNLQKATAAQEPPYTATTSQNQMSVGSAR